MARHSDKQRAWFGRVVSNKMQKTVVVAVERFEPHAVYRKMRRRVTKLKAHDETNQCQVGDEVKVVSTRPLSKEKHWRVVEVLRQGESQR